MKASNLKELHISSDELENLSRKLALKIFEKDSVNCPDLIVGIERGGYQIALFIQEELNFAFKKIIPFIPIKATSYDKNNIRREVKVEEVENIMRKLGQIDEVKNILFVDDVFDSGKTFEAISNSLKTIKDFSISFTSLHYKPDNNVTEPRIEPIYIQKIKSDCWIHYPHERKEKLLLKKHLET